MAAYVIANIDVTDPAAYDQYRQGVLPTIERYGGRFLVRGGAAESFEGTWTPKRIVVLEFPGMDQARAWYRSTEYAPLLEMRKRASKGDLFIVAGV
jgi:uncharacterized protein (DUF1330 family)